MVLGAAACVPNPAGSGAVGLDVAKGTEMLLETPRGRPSPRRAPQLGAVGKVPVFLNSARNILSKGLLRLPVY